MTFGQSGRKVACSRDSLWCFDCVGLREKVQLFIPETPISFVEGEGGGNKTYDVLEISHNNDPLNHTVN